MIESTTGNLLQADVDALVNTVNCVGVMGKGIALQFKQAFPAMFEDYRRAARAGQVEPGRMHVFVTGALVGPRFLIGFPTKRHWKAGSRLEDIDAGLLDLVAQVRDRGIRSIAIPPLGAGNGGLNWADVRPRIVEAFQALPDVRVLLFEPGAEPRGAERRPPPAREPLTVARALILSLLDLYRRPRYALTLLEVQKLAYFLQIAGEPLRLRFEASHYGPYAHAINHVLRRLEGHYLQGATDVKPGTEITLLGTALPAADEVLTDQPQARARLARVADLIEGFETPHGMELLATVHWVVAEGARDVEQAIAAVHAWSDRKRRIFLPHHIQVAYGALDEGGWLAG
ncbi:MAG: macro domain-containing protein [Myxococcales bacterium]|nr:macro domain-containing protein [Myxococcales bacterium]MCB9549966.1 macro domain-containing protein [Myxococcales bacterium]